MEEACIENNSEEVNSLYTDFIKELYEMYAKLVESGVNKEDARYVLPNASLTNIVVTMNFRELYHFFTLRCCNRASLEIRRLANEMLSMMKYECPSVFENAGPSCRRGKCSEGHMSCGNLY